MHSILNLRPIAVVWIAVVIVFAPACAAPAVEGEAAHGEPASNPHSQPQYWIVSSRNCAQSPGAVVSGCCLEYEYATACGCHFHSDEQAFRVSLQPDVPVCIFVHGSYVLPHEIRPGSQNAFRWIRSAAPDRPLNVVFYTWPSEAAIPGTDVRMPISLGPHIDFAVLGNRSEANGFQLAGLVGNLPENHPVALVCHSHGARAVSSALHLLGGGQVSGYWMPHLIGKTNRIRAVFAVGAIDRDWLNPGKRYGQALCRAELLLNLQNQQDLALSLYPLGRPFSRQALGRIGLTPKDRSQLGWLSTKVIEADVSPLIGRTHWWPEYYSRPEIAELIAPYVYFMHP